MSSLLSLFLFRNRNYLRFNSTQKSFTSSLRYCSKSSESPYCSFTRILRYPSMTLSKFSGSGIFSPFLMISFGSLSADYTSVQDILPVLKFWSFYSNINAERGKIFDNSFKIFPLFYTILYYFIYASSIAFPMSWRIYLLSNFTHSVAAYAFARASFKVAPLAVTPSTRPPFVTI